MSSIRLKTLHLDVQVRTIAEVHQIGESLPLPQQVYRVKIVMSFLCAGVPLNKL